VVVACCVLMASTVPPGRRTVDYARGNGVGVCCRRGRVLPAWACAAGVGVCCRRGRVLPAWACAAAFSAAPNWILRFLLRCSDGACASCGQATKGGDTSDATSIQTSSGGDSRDRRDCRWRGGARKRRHLVVVEYLDDSKHDDDDPAQQPYRAAGQLWPGRYDCPRVTQLPQHARLGASAVGRRASTWRPPRTLIECDPVRDERVDVKPPLEVQQALEPWLADQPVSIS
jgi:hypothetical protein